MGNKTSTLLKVINLHPETLSNSGSSDQHVKTKRNIYKMQWPFSAVLPRPLNAGDSIEIEAKIADDTNVFTVNLVGEYDSGNKPHNVAYHHKMLFDEQRTVINSKVNGQWREEVDSSEMHVTPGETFKMLILVKEDTITAYFNDMHHSDFEHDFNLGDIKYLEIWHGLDKVISMKITFAE